MEDKTTTVNKEGIETPPDFDNKNEEAKTPIPQKTHWKKLQNPDYLGSYDFQPNEERVLTVKKVFVKAVEAEKTTDCTIVEFVEKSKPMILNSTNAKTLTKIFESPYIEDWTGKSFKVVVKPIKAFGEIVDALRIKSEKVAKIKPLLILNSKTFNSCRERYQADKNTLVKIKENYVVSPEVETALTAE